MNRTIAGLLLLTFAATPLNAQAKTVVQKTQAKPAQSATPLDLSTPQKTLESFVAAFNAHDLNQAVRCILWAQPDSKERAAMQSGFAKNKVALSIRGLRVETTGDDATVRLMATFHYSNIGIRLESGVGGIGDAEDTYFSQVRLHRQSETWMIVPDDLAVSFNKVTIENPLLSKITRIAYAEVKPTTDEDLVKMKQILVATVQYLIDSNQKFVGQGAQSFEESVKTFGQIGQIGYTKSNGEKVDFKFNENLRDANTSSIGTAANTVMFYEADRANTKLAFPFGKSVVVGFVDGHVERISSQQADSLEWK